MFRSVLEEIVDTSIDVYKDQYLLKFDIDEGKNESTYQCFLQK